MNQNKAELLYMQLESDRDIQNLIAQGDSRYLLFNVHEPVGNFPRYSSGLDRKLTSIALSYLSVGCSFAENNDLNNLVEPLEKGATILENVYSPTENKTEFSSYFVLASALAFYAANHYSKSFIVLKHNESVTLISKLISLFLKRDYNKLSIEITSILFSENNNGSNLVQFDEDVANNIVYTYILAKGLSCLLEFIYSGNDMWLDRAKDYLSDLIDLLSIDEEPSMWWVIRLLIIIINGFANNSLWKTVHPLMGTNQISRNYILSLAFQKSPIVELFHSQKIALEKILNPLGAVVCLPTSSGKTRIAEIAILQSLICDPHCIILYLAPFRSLAFEIEDSLSKIFKPLGIEVSHLYGGTQFSKIDELMIEESSILIATPEKAKAMLRSNSEIKDRLKLLIIDEGHLLGAEERYVTSEMLIDELRLHTTNNQGKTLLLSAVLPNSREIAKWITTNEENVVESNWRPSTQRFGLLEYNGSNVNLNWKGDIESFNRNFIQLFKVQRPRSEYVFPKDKKQAVAATAIKLSLSGSVLVFVARKNMVLSQAKEILLVLGDITEEHTWSNPDEWRTFQLACEEAYGQDSNLFIYAKYGVICHHSGIINEVKLSIERLIRNSNPRIIVSTSTLGQGVNIGISSVIVANVWIGRNKVKKNDFWNIAGRAGRSFVDREGKILFAVDSSQGIWRAKRDRDLARGYFESGNQQPAISGLLYIIRYIYRVAREANIDFDLLLQLISENDLSHFNETSISTIQMLFDLIDDTLLSLNQEFDCNPDEESFWIDEYFRKSLAFIQRERFEMNENDIISFLKVRNKGVLKLAGERSNWTGLISSSIPLRSGIFIKNEVPRILTLLSQYLASAKEIEDLITLLRNIEQLVSTFPSKQFQEKVEVSEVVRDLWIRGKPLNLISDKELLNDCSQYFSFTLPWAINAIARILNTLEFEEEAKVFEELAVLVQIGLPNLLAAKIYMAGIQSRAVATELSSNLEPEMLELSVNRLRKKLIEIAQTLTLTGQAKEWIEVLIKSDLNIQYTEKMVPFIFTEKLHVKNNVLSVKEYDGIYYLCSPDYEDKIQVEVTEDLPFDKFSEDQGVCFEFSESNQWEMKVRNPLKVNQFDLLSE